MRLLASVGMHYGRDTLAPTLASVQDFVDGIYIAYSAKPWQIKTQHKAPPPCPESREELREIAMAFPRVVWEEAEFWSVETQRAGAFRYAEQHGINALLTLDSDEVWHSDSLRMLAAMPALKERNASVRFLHWWQGLERACDDGQVIHRITTLAAPSGSVTLELPQPVHHLGYCIPDDLMAYKWAIHEHRDELRPDWFEQRWLARATEDVHPVNRNFWNAIPRDQALLKGTPLEKR